MGIYGDNGKENRNHYGIRGILEFYWDNGKENGNYYLLVQPRPSVRRESMLRRFLCDIDPAC